MDNFREWLSDNLRYFMLGGAILVIVAVLFFGVRACIGSGKGTSKKEQNTVEDNSQGNDCLLYTSPSPRDGLLSRMPSSA